MTHTNTSIIPAAFATHPKVERHPSIPLPPIAHTDAINATQNLVERLEANLTPKGPIEDEQWYGWIPLPLNNFYAGILTAREILGPGHHKFLDVGSGIGTKLVIAHELGWQTAGIERWEPYVETSGNIAPFATVYAMNALEPIIRYEDHDLVYCYGLAADAVEDGQIKRQIITRMKPGGLFMTARRPFPDLEQVGPFLWRK